MVMLVGFLLVVALWVGREGIRLACWSELACQALLAMWERLGVRCSLSVFWAPILVCLSGRLPASWRVGVMQPSLLLASGSAM